VEASNLLKRQFSRKGPETSGYFAAETASAGVWRQNRTREKPGFPGLSGPGRKLSADARRGGWRRSADRACLQPNSLQTGNFTGKTGDSGSSETRP